jgi:hypothetical protein
LSGLLLASVDFLRALVVLDFVAAAFFVAIVISLS